MPERHVLVRAALDRPMVVRLVAHRGPIVDVRADGAEITVSFPAYHVFEPNPGLLAQLRDAEARRDVAALRRLWDEATPFDLATISQERDP